MSYPEYPEFEAYQQRRNANRIDSHTHTITSVVLGAIIGAYILIKALDLLGFPVWLRIHQLVEMASGILRLRGPSFDQRYDPESSDDDIMQRGGMFGSLFALSPGNLLQKGVRGVANAFATGPSDVPPGLGNISNSCYQNSVIQGLASLPSLREYLFKTTSEHPSLSPESTNGALFDIITKLNNPENKGSHFWIRGKLKSMSTFEQQDAQEYFSKILDALDEEVKKTSSSKRRSSVSWLEVTKSLSDSPGIGYDAQEGAKDATDKSGTASEQPQIVPNPLEGRLAQRVGCTSCGYSEGLTLIPFNCITVSLGRNYSYDIRECLDEYTTLEFIDGVECAKCTLLKLKKTLSPLVAAQPDSPLKSRLDAVEDALEKEDFEDKTLLKTLNVPKKNWIQSTKSKQAVVARAPQSLVLHVNRSSFNENTGMSYKNTAGVSYPTVLDLGNWCLGNTLGDASQSGVSEEEWPRDPRESMLAGGDPTTDSPFQYRLRAAVTHYGSHGNGHYVCYRPHPRAAPQAKREDTDATATEGDSEELEALSTQDELETVCDEQWWRFSDDTVYPVSENEAHQGNVFMLFYERIDEQTPSTPRVADAVAESISVAEDAPLPPAHVASGTLSTVDDEALEMALPDDEEDELFQLIPPQSPLSTPSAPVSSVPAQLSSEAHNTPLPNPAQRETEPERETSDAESEDAPSTNLTSDDYDSEFDVPTPAAKAIPVPQISPHLMRTAGNKAKGNTQSLPLVSAT